MEESSNHTSATKMMKLRIRCIETKQTLKISTPTSSTLQSLKQIISQQISSSPQTLHLSLNRQEQLISPSPQQDSLSSLGIASGDLIYYTQNPNAFSASQQGMQISESSSSVDKKVESLETPCQENMQIDKKIETLETPLQENMEIGKKIEPLETLETPIEENDEVMEVEGETLVKNLSSVPRFLQKVYKEEVGDGGSEGDYKLLIISVHAVFLEAGFVCFDDVERKPIEGFRLPGGWHEKAMLIVRYTLPELVNDKEVKTVELKFYKLGKFVNVHGCLSGGNPVGKFRLDEKRFVSSVKSVCTSESEAGSGIVFELWKIAKDGLALPLLIDLCETSGLELPPCFMRIPTELKVKILELLPGEDVGRVGCVCSELRYMASNNDLWKQKYIEEFAPTESGLVGKKNWKENYVEAKERLNKRRRVHCQRAYRPMRGDPGPFPFPGTGIGGGVPNPRLFGFPGVIGGDWDRFPAFPAPFGSRQINRGTGRRNFGLHGNFDMFDA